MQRSIHVRYVVLQSWSNRVESSFHNLSVVFSSLCLCCLSSEGSYCFFQPCVYFFELCRLLYLMSDPACARETSFRGLVDVTLKYGLFACGGSGISRWAPTVCSWVWLPHQRMSMKALLWGKNVAVWHAEGWWMEWHPAEQRGAQTVEELGQPPGPPERLLLCLSHLWSFFQEVWMRGAMVLIIFITCRLLVRWASGWSEHLGVICRWKQVQISVSESSPPTWFQPSLFSQTYGSNCSHAFAPMRVCLHDLTQEDLAWGVSSGLRDH